MEDNIQTSISVHHQRNLPRDVFLHLFSMMSLYWSVISFITLSWQYINYFFPDVLAIKYGVQDYIWPIRFSVSSLVIVFPLFILSSWYLNKIYQRETVVRESKIRKWLIYLTLFIASLMIVGDLVTLIYTFLGGDVTIKFIFKAVSMLIVTGAIFGYYLDDVRRSELSKLAKYYVWTASMIILILVVGAFFIVGSPNQARLMQLDEQRISDLQNIQSQIVNYWQKKGQLPNNVTDLNDSISGFFNPQDPKTNQMYEYTIKDSKSLTFELCATFSLDSKIQGGKSISSYPVYEGGISQNWDHSADHFCFKRTIDKQLYPPYPAPEKVK